MVCEKCGKIINDDEKYCSDCAPKEAPAEDIALDTSEPVESAEATESVESAENTEFVAESEPVEESDDTAEEQEKIEKKVKTMGGYGYALLSAILGILAYFISYVAYMLLADDGVFSSLVDGAPASIIIFVLAVILSVGIGAVSVIMSIKSIRVFVSAVANDQLKTTHAVVLGVFQAIMTVLAIFSTVMVLVIFAVLIF